MNLIIALPILIAVTLSVQLADAQVASQATFSLGVPIGGATIAGSADQIISLESNLKGSWIKKSSMAGYSDLIPAKTYRYGDIYFASEYNHGMTKTVAFSLYNSGTDTKVIPLGAFSSNGMFHNPLGKTKHAPYANKPSDAGYHLELQGKFLNNAGGVQALGANTRVWDSNGFAPRSFVIPNAKISDIGIIDAKLGGGYIGDGTRPLDAKITQSLIGGPDHYYAYVHDDEYTKAVHFKMSQHNNGIKVELLGTAHTKGYTDNPDLLDKRDVQLAHSQKQAGLNQKGYGITMKIVFNDHSSVADIGSMYKVCNCFDNHGFVSKDGVFIPNKDVNDIAHILTSLGGKWVGDGKRPVKADVINQNWGQYTATISDDGYLKQVVFYVTDTPDGIVIKPTSSTYLDKAPSVNGKEKSWSHAPTAYLSSDDGYGLASLKIIFSDKSASLWTDDFVSHSIGKTVPVGFGKDVNPKQLFVASKVEAYLGGKWIVNQMDSAFVKMSANHYYAYVHEDGYTKTVRFTMELHQGAVTIDVIDAFYTKGYTHNPESAQNPHPIPVAGSASEDGYGLWLLRAHQ